MLEITIRSHSITKSVNHIGRYCLGVDVDQGALDVCSANLAEFEMTRVDLLQADIKSLSSQIEDGRLHKCVNTVIMNPPFGTKNNAGIHNFLCKKMSG